MSRAVWTILLLAGLAACATPEVTERYRTEREFYQPAGTAERLEIEIDGAGDIEANGKVEYLKLHVDGAGDIDTRDLEAERADVVINGAGDVKVYVHVLGNSGNCTDSIPEPLGAHRAPDMDQVQRLPRSPGFVYRSQRRYAQFADDLEPARPGVFQQVTNVGRDTEHRGRTRIRAPEHRVRSSQR